MNNHIEVEVVNIISNEVLTDVEKMKKVLDAIKRHIITLTASCSVDLLELEVMDGKKRDDFNQLINSRLASELTYKILDEMDIEMERIDRFNRCIVNGKVRIFKF